MSCADRVAGLFAVTNAGAGTAISIYVTTDGIDRLEWPIALIVLTGLAGAWIGAWAWWKSRWGLAAAGTFLSLGVPWGYFLLLWWPVVLTLSAAAIVNGRRSRGEIRGARTMRRLVGTYLLAAFVLFIGLTSFVLPILIASMVGAAALILSKPHSRGT